VRSVTRSAGSDTAVKSRARAAVILLATLLPATAFANAGTPLMWATLLHLVVGNAFIGLFEALLLRWIFKAPLGRSIIVLIMANYASAWGGALLLGFLGYADITIENLRFYSGIFVAMAFALTLFIEFPFFCFLLRKQSRVVARSAAATIVINLVSYSALCFWYWSASGTSLMTRVEVVPAESLLPREPYVLYFITPDGRHIERTDLAGRHREQVAEVSASDGNDRLFARKDADGKYSLFLLLYGDGGPKYDEQTIRHGFSTRTTIDRIIEEGRREQPLPTYAAFGTVPSLVDDSEWKYEIGIYAVEGLVGHNEKRGLKNWFSLELPFAMWMMRSGTQIAGDRVVFQLGRDQICIFDPQARKIALIARGKGPIVALP